MSYTLETPIDLTYEIEFNAIEYSVDELVLDSHVRIRVVFSGDKGNHQVKYAVIQGAAYDSWGSDDGVILKLLVANIVSLGECDRELVIAFPLAGKSEVVEEEGEDVIDTSTIEDKPVEDKVVEDKVVEEKPVEEKAVEEEAVDEKDVVVE